MQTIPTQLQPLAKAHAIGPQMQCFTCTYSWMQFFFACFVCVSYFVLLKSSPNVMNVVTGPTSNTAMSRSSYLTRPVTTYCMSFLHWTVEVFPVEQEIMLLSLTQRICTGVIFRRNLPSRIYCNRRKCARQDLPRRNCFKPDVVHSLMLE